MLTKDYQNITFDELLNDYFEWVRSYFNLHRYDEFLIDKEYDGYIVYHCWNNSNKRIITYRVKKKKVCECCGREL